MRVALKEIYKYYDPSKPAVRELDLDIPSGKLTTILGPSGCGKTTTMLMIAGLEKPSNGDIFFDEKNVKNMSPKYRNIGMVFQSSALYPSMTVKENISFPLVNQKVLKKDIEPKVHRVLEMVNMLGFEDRKPHQLSGGQRQRVAIARALVKEPDLLILDEPLSALDASLRMKLREEIRNLQQSLGITTIMVTHDQEEAISMSDYIAVMKDGELQQFSPTSAILNEPANWFVSSFMGMPFMNRLDCQYQAHSHSLLVPGIGTIKLQEQELKQVTLQDNEPLILGFRPHQVELSFEKPSNGTELKGKVTYVEHTGRELMVTIQLNGIESYKIKAVCPDHQQVRLQSEVWLSIQTYQFLFESEGKQRNIYLTSERKMKTACGV
ncbi:ABC transporter ATP-binding protein [Bacillus sp. FJAT-42315]|uniref:ABC transporter ATP-binding protein n=1 Tax=Bacillus sp. FJAT-42315 TaxID=2014077 RepID=UPI000C2497F9|nr:ABC transporter ATP-binding protein [Bacillus sp. FJAT-42315]